MLLEDDLRFAEVVRTPDVEPQSIVMEAPDIAIGGPQREQQRGHVEVFVGLDQRAHRLAPEDVDPHADVIEALRLLAIGGQPFFRRRTR